MHLYVCAVHDYTSEEESSLSFKKGDIIEVVSKLDSGWWDGSLNGEHGWFPSNYVINYEHIDKYENNYDKQNHLNNTINTPNIHSADRNLLNQVQNSQVFSHAIN